jgi:hypothetical protein
MWQFVFGYGSSDISIHRDAFFFRGYGEHYFLNEDYPEIKDTNWFGREGKTTAVKVVKLLLIA